MGPYIFCAIAGELALAFESDRTQMDGDHAHNFDYVQHWNHPAQANRRLEWATSQRLTNDDGEHTFPSLEQKSLFP